MPRFDLDSYDTVDERLTKFRAEHPDGAVHSEIVSEMSTLDKVLFRASVYFHRDDTRPAGVDAAYGERDMTDYKRVDYASWVENCSTSAIGRALAAAGYKAKKDSPRPSREEMEKAGATTRPSVTNATRQGAAPSAPRRDSEIGEVFPDRAPRGTKTADVVAYFKQHGFDGQGGVQGMIREVEQTYGVVVKGTAPDGGYYPSDAYNALAYYVAGDGEAQAQPQEEMADVPF